MCRYRSHPGTPSATGFPPGKLCHHHSTLIHLCGHTYTSKFPCNSFLLKKPSQNISLGLKRPYVVHTWTLLCHFPSKCSSSSDRYLRGGPTSLQCDSCCRCHGTTLMMGKIIFRKIKWNLLKFQICSRAQARNSQKNVLDESHRKWPLPRPRHLHHSLKPVSDIRSHSPPTSW